MEAKLKDLTDEVTNSRNIEIAVFRDIMMQAFPGLAKLSEVGELVISAATPTPVSSSLESPQVATQLPPEAALQLEEEEEEEEGVGMSEEELREAVNVALPFVSDLEVFDLVKLKSVTHYIIKYVHSHKPEGMLVSTSDSTYVDFVLATLFSSSYMDGHAIPRSIEVSNYPLLPRKLIYVLHKIGEHGISGKEEFDIEDFWRLVRAKFATSAFNPAPGKPTVTSLVNQAMGAVADEENQESLLQRKFPKEKYNMYRKEQESLRESPRYPPMPAAASGGAKDAAPLDETSDMDQTMLNLRNRTVKASKTTEFAKTSTGTAVHTRRRTHDEVYRTETEERGDKKSKKTKR